MIKRPRRAFRIMSMNLSLTSLLILFSLAIMSSLSITVPEIITIVKTKTNSEIIDQITGNGKLDYGYFRYDEFWEIIQSLQKEFPQFIGKTQEFGKSVQKNSLQGFILGKDAGKEESVKNKNLIFINSSHHAREAVSFEMVLLFILLEINKLIANQEKAKIYDFVSIVVYPVVNVDGVIRINQDFNSQMNRRKNLRPNPTGNCPVQADDGVDINRNYDIEYYSNQEFTENPCGDEFKGAGPFSEPETQTVRKILDDYSNIVTAINLHCWGNLWVHPYNYLKPGEPGEMKTVQPELNILYEDFKTKGKLPTNVVIAEARVAVSYSASGEASDWMARNRGILAWSPELGSSNKQTEDFYISPSLQREVIKAQYPTIEDLIERHLPALEVVDTTGAVREGLDSSFILSLRNKGYSKIKDIKVEVELNPDKFDNTSMVLLKEFKLLSLVKENVTSGIEVPRLGHVQLKISFQGSPTMVSVSDFRIKLTTSVSPTSNIFTPIPHDLVSYFDQKMMSASMIAHRGPEGVIYLIIAVLMHVGCAFLLGPRMLRQRLKFQLKSVQAELQATLVIPDIGANSLEISEFPENSSTGILDI